MIDKLFFGVVALAVTVWSAILIYALYTQINKTEAQHERTVQQDILHDMCKSSSKYDTWLAPDGNDWVCFRQNIDTKKISKQLIVIPE